MSERVFSISCRVKDMTFVRRVGGERLEVHWGRGEQKERCGRNLKAAGRYQTGWLRSPISDQWHKYSIVCYLSKAVLSGDRFSDRL